MKLAVDTNALSPLFLSLSPVNPSCFVPSIRAAEFLSLEQSAVFHYDMGYIYLIEMAEIFMNHALIILCGGGSTRMGTDKALLPFGEVSLLEYLVNKYKPHFSHIYLSVKKPGEYTHLSLPVTEIADLYMNAGPMSGVFSGLSMMDEDQAFILPIDTPFLEPEVGLQLLEHLDGFDIAAVSGTETDQKVPASAYSKSCLPSIGKCLLLHQFTFDTLREKCSVSYLKREEATKDSDIPADLQFSHLDTRDDYYLALRHLHCI
jgi:molybdopterin-guanine dinucleotide biosynthesis protein A